MLELARTDLKAQSYQTLLGQLWLILNPLLLAGVYCLLRVIIRGTPEGSMDFFSLLFAGLFLFTYTRASLLQGAASVVTGSQLILNSAFPRALLPLTGVVTAFGQFAPTLAVLP